MINENAPIKTKKNKKRKQNGLGKKSKRTTERFSLYQNNEVFNGRSTFLCFK